MAKQLVIVEAPTKAKTLERYLGSDYSVTASRGHVRDLPEDRMGVDVEDSFTPEYIVPEEKAQTVEHRKVHLRSRGSSTPSRRQRFSTSSSRPPSRFALWRASP